MSKIVHPGREEKPIIFQPWKVKKIMEWDWSESTMETRRLIIPQPADILPARGKLSGAYVTLRERLENIRDQRGDIIRCPYGQPGTLLYVRETFVKFDFSHWPPKYGYKADSLGHGFEESELARKDLGYKWKPSIHMPKEAVRLWLEVVDIRVEKLHQMGGTSAWKEGSFTVQQFKEIWNQINDKRGHGWNVNPWVWVVEYKLFEKAGQP